ncbi:DUF1775 domain-containing protein [Micromonospora sp. CA-249363]|uniref:DUF1775 domain-containing protein n=1 Tax=Micromonospora sp. CA-249363 TaxID=3239963 RepID=UPI003D8AF20C
MASTHGGGRPRRIAAVTALTAAGLLLWPASAAQAADVTTTPTEARQGDAVRLEFSVPEERAGTKSKQIEIRLPADAPVAEVYPMSVDGWAPRIDSKTLDKPVAGIHSSGVSTVTTAVTWVRVGQGATGPAKLALSMGPMPQAERLTFEVVQTYADGTVVRWTDADGDHRAPVLTLLPAAPGAAGPAVHGGHGAPAAGTANGPAAGAQGGAAAGTSGEESGNADAMLAAGLLAGLGGGAAIGWLVSRWRRRDPAEDAALAEITGDPADAAAQAGETAAAGAAAQRHTTAGGTAARPDDTTAGGTAARTDTTPADAAARTDDTTADAAADTAAAGVGAAAPVDTAAGVGATAPVDTAEAVPVGAPARAG